MYKTTKDAAMKGASTAEAKPGAGFSKAQAPDRIMTQNSKPLLFAAQTGDLLSLRQALAAGIDINAQDPVNGFAALTYAAQNGHAHVVAFLLFNNAKVDIRDKHDATPLMRACWGGYEKAAAMLVAKGADVNTCDSAGWTPFINACHKACDTRNLDLVKFLLPMVADINEKNELGWSSFYLAIANCYDGLELLLRQHGAHE